MNGLYELSFGDRDNVVPDQATATVDKIQEASFEKYIKNHHYKGKVEDLGNGKVKLTAYGKNAHAMEPDDGLNAGFILTDFLNTVLENRFLQFMVEYINFDSRAKKLGLAFDTEIMKELTVNAGVCRYTEGEFSLVLNFRYPIGFDVTNMEKKMNVICEQFTGFKHIVERNQVPHYVDPNSEFVKTLHEAYIKYTDDHTTPLMTIGGGTYARSLKKAVAFGPMMPGRVDVVHQPNEYIIIEDLLKATAIYAEAIYHLTR
jgi:succinyl-diaminopimelate desuccinylase